jgi:hypothetical protein
VGGGVALIVWLSPNDPGAETFTAMTVAPIPSDSAVTIVSQ